MTAARFERAHPLALVTEKSPMLDFSDDMSTTEVSDTDEFLVNYFADQVWARGIQRSLLI